MLEVSDLRHRFGPQVAVDGASFAVARGEIVGLVGRNGAGKTTTMRAIIGIITPQGGTVTWDGSPISGAERQRFGYMPEERGLYPQMPIGQQVRYFARLHGLSARAATEASAAWLPSLGLAGREGDRLNALSHGNQQRVQLAVAIAHDPELLVLDEPFAGLDPAAVDKLVEVIASRAAAGTAVLFSSHQLDLVERICQHVVIVDHGKVLADGSLHDLRQRLPRHLRVKVAGGAGWAAVIPGVTVLGENDEGVVLGLGDGVDPQVVLNRALAAGKLEHFGFETGGLPDVYRQLVSG